jgi:uncharacterized protein YkwD
MAGKHAFRPAGLEGREQLEARLVLSHAGLAHLVVPLVHGGGHHHAPVHVVHKGHHEVPVHVVHKGHHGKVVTGGSGTQTNSGPTEQSNPTTPVVVVPVQDPPVSSPPTSSTPTQDPTTTTPTIPIPTVSGVMSAQEQTIVDLVNQQRAANGLAPLQVNSELVVAAQIHSSDMATLGQMLHTLPGAALPTLQSRAQYVGYNYSYLGENIAFNYPDDNSVMTAWMNSPGHRANILDPNYTEIGVGIAYDSLGEPYYTQEFGQPA